MPEFICPNCEAAIDEFCYTLDTTGYEWGRARFNHRTQHAHAMDLDCSESETNDSNNLRFECPECNESIEENLIEAFLQQNYTPNNENSSTTRLETNPISDAPRIIRKEENIVSLGYQKILNTCENCSYQFLAENENDECPRCSITKIKLTI